TLCGDDCVDTTSDDLHCSGCNDACPTGQSCSSSVCECDTGTKCETSTDVFECIDTQTSWFHCGACNDPCEIGEECSSEDCQAIVCETGELCGNGCIDPQTDEDNCGGCTFSTSSEDADGMACIIGECPCSSGSGLDAGTSDSGVQDEYECPIDETWATCVDLTSNRDHCSACDEACPTGQECVDSACQPIVCGETQILCDNTCVWGSSCGVACEIEMGEECSSGDCGCPGVDPSLCSNMCVDLDSDPYNCGDCYNYCEEDETCTGGECIVEPCEGNLVRCWSECVDTDTNTTHCGGCSVGGSSVGEACETGTCQCGDWTECPVEAPEGYAECANLTNSRNHCGSCEIACETGDECVDSSCVPIVCTPLTLCENTCVESPACGVTCETSETCVEGACQ
ncbi:MAG: hypothetical protein GY847_06390, partial [Proteobacteria bacterium]|nr:hypothetical protein [Pseudomonadota bacterium]